MYSAAADRNKQIIFDELKPFLEQTQSVLEIGSGTGQHAAFFSQQLPEMVWQLSDQGDYYTELRAYIASQSIENLIAPIEIDVNLPNWLQGTADYNAIYSANTLHIMNPISCENFLSAAARHLCDRGWLFLYGPFKYQGEFTSESNKDFDLSLKQRGFGDGIKDFEWISEILSDSGFKLIRDISMPANNQLLIWQLTK